jgi:hypothetical protein
MPNTYSLIASSTVGSGGAASIDFTSIPQTYTDLVLKISARSTSNSGVSWAGMRLAINGSGTGYSNTALYGDGSSVSTSGASFVETGIASSSSATGSTFGNTDVYLTNYTASQNKSISADGVQENNAVQALSVLSANLWSNTAAITSISITLQSGIGNFAQYTTAYLYGIKNS